MYILINALNIKNNEEICINMKGDRKTGYQVNETGDSWVNPFFADIGVNHEDYSEIIREVMKPGTHLLYMDYDEVTYMATEHYHIRVHVLPIRNEEVI